MKRGALTLALLFIAVLMSAYAALYLLSSGGNLADELPRFSAGQILAIAFLSLLPFLLSATAVKMVLDDMGYRRNIKDVFLVWSASLATNYSLPNAAVPVRLYMMRERLGIPLSVASSGVVLETAMFLASLLAMGFVTCMFFFSGYAAIPLAVFFAVACIIASVCLLKGRLPGTWWERILGGRVYRFLKSMKDSIHAVTSGTLAFLFIICILNIVLSGLRLLLVLSALGFNVALSHLLFNQSMSTLVGQLSPIPGGVGPKDASIAGLLSVDGIPIRISLLAAFIERILTSGVAVVVGILSSFLLGVNIIRDTRQNGS